MEDLEIASHIKHEQDFQKQYGSYANMLQQRNEEKSSIKLEPIIQSEVSQKEKHQYSILTNTVY